MFIFKINNRIDLSEDYGFGMIALLIDAIFFLLFFVLSFWLIFIKERK